MGGLRTRMPSMSLGLSRLQSRRLDLPVTTNGERATIAVRKSGMHTAGPGATRGAIGDPDPGDAGRIFPDPGIIPPNLDWRVLPTHPLTTLSTRSRITATVLVASSVAALIYGGMLAMGTEQGVTPGVEQAGMWGGLLTLLGGGWHRFLSIFSSSESPVPVQPVRIRTPVGTPRPSTPVHGVGPVRRSSGTRPAGHPDTSPFHTEPVERTPSHSNIPASRREPRVTAPGAMVEEAVQIRMRLLEQQVGYPVSIAQMLSEIEGVIPGEGKGGIFVVVERVDHKIEVRIAEEGPVDKLILDGEHKKSGGPIPVGRSETIIMLARLGGMRDE